jgi:hypothetical protein
LGFADVDAWVYASLFETPAEDAWLGLVDPTVYTGLVDGGSPVGSLAEAHLARRDSSAVAGESGSLALMKAKTKVKSVVRRPTTRTSTQSRGCLRA